VGMSSLVPGKNFRHLVRLNLGMDGFVYHQGRGLAAKADTSADFQAVAPIGRALAGVDSQFPAQALQVLGIAPHVAGRTQTEADGVRCVVQNCRGLSD